MKILFLSDHLLYMVGQNFAEVKLHRKSGVKSLASVNNLIKIRGKEMVVLPQQMLNRILSFFSLWYWFSSINEVWTSPRPPSLFNAISFRRPAKAALASLLLALVPPGPTVIPQNPVYVIDGGHLLHSVVWPSPATYAEICQSLWLICEVYYR